MALSDLEIINRLGPLAGLAGSWQGDKGDDRAPSDDRGVENNKYREKISFVPFGPVNNHEQELFGLRYQTTAWRIGEEDSFHEELGYWLWDEKNEQVMRSFMVPRGVTVLAGGKVKAADRDFFLSAEAGSCTYGICSNLFLDREFKTVKYELRIKILSAHSFSYEENSKLLLKGQTALFDHIDQNTLIRV